jgi:hypothetical protein
MTKMKCFGGGLHNRQAGVRFRAAPAAAPSGSGSWGPLYTPQGLCSISAAFPFQRPPVLAVTIPVKSSIKMEKFSAVEVWTALF